MAAASSQQAQARKAAGDAAETTNAASIKNAKASYANQEDTMRWQDTTWQQDIDFATQNLDYEQKEFAKQAGYVADTGKAILTNEGAAMAATALATVQKNIAVTLKEADLGTSAAQARATAQVGADGRGVSGNSVNAIIDDVSRQQGEATSTMELNRSAINQQARLDIQGQKAAGDTQIGELAASVKVYSPSTPIRTPGPVGNTVSPTILQPAEQSGLANSLAIGAAGIQGAATGFNTFNTLSGSTSKETVGAVGSFLGIT